jgi:hypothetical protein
MGQGRPFPHFWHGINLIADGNQGIAPDSEDFASLKSLEIICPMPASDFGSPEKAEAVADVCEPNPTDQGSWIRQVGNGIPIPARMLIRTCPVILSLHFQPVAAGRDDELRPHGRLPQSVDSDAEIDPLISPVLGAEPCPSRARSRVVGS